MAHERKSSSGAAAERGDRENGGKRSGDRRAWLLPAIIAVTTFLAFLPALQNGFVNWDDPYNLLENSRYRGFSWPHLRWMASTFHMGHYHPFTWLSFALDYQIWGMNPFGYHLTNLILHSLTAVLFYFAAVRLLKSAMTNSVSEKSLRAASAIAALLFSIHPLRVESVAWATERRDVLSGVFTMLTLLYYLKRSDSQGGGHSRRWYLLALMFYGCSLLSKAAAITLPMILLILDVYPLRRLKVGNWFGRDVRRVWWEKLPFALLAMPAALAALAAQRAGGALATTEFHDLTGRVAQAFFGITFYLVKTLAPTDLSPLYEMPLDADPFHWRFIRSAAIVLLLTVAFFAARRRWPAGLAVWLCYLLLLAPVLGFAQSGPQMVADRYSYLSCMVWAILIAAALPLLWRFKSRGLFGASVSSFSAVTALLIILGAGGLTWRQAKFWHDSVTLWRHALAVTPSGLVHYNLGNALELSGQNDEAIEHIKKALEVYPAYANAHHGLGRLMVHRGDLEEAAAHLRAAEKLNPRARGIYKDLGIVLAKQGRLAEASRHFHRALEIDPGDTVALNNLGIVFGRQGKLDEAIHQFRRALAINPEDAGSQTNLANALLARGDTDGALKHFSRAVEINPNDPENFTNLAMISVGRGDLIEAGKYQRRALEFRPRDAAAYNNLAIILANQGELSESVKLFEQALGLDWNLASAHAALARVLKVQGKSKEAMIHYQEALRILKAHKNTPVKE